MSRDGAIALEPRPYCIDHPVTDERTWLRTLDEARYQATVARWEAGTHFPLRYAGAIEEVLDITIPAPVKA